MVTHLQQKQKKHIISYFVGSGQAEAIALTFNMLDETINVKIIKNNFFQCRYNLMLHADSLAWGDVFKKLKYGSIIIGCWDIH